MKVSTLLYCSILFWSVACGAEPECDLTIRDGNAAQDLDRVLRCFDQRLKALESGHAKTRLNSSNLPGPNFIPGNYQSPDGKWTCTVGASTLSSGRQEGSVSCKHSDATSNNWLTASFTSGPLEGHTFESDLRKAGIDKITGMADYAWGIAGTQSDSSGNAVWNCFSAGDLISARQSGSQINITNYGSSYNSDLGNTNKCAMALAIKQ